MACAEALQRKGEGQCQAGPAAGLGDTPLSVEAAGQGAGPSPQTSHASRSQGQLLVPELKLTVPQLLTNQ